MAPSLSQVVAQGGQAFSFSFMHLAVALMAVCALAFSAVKGYEVIRRGRWLSAAGEDISPLAEVQNREELDKLNLLVEESRREIEELRRGKDHLASQKLQLESQLHRFENQKQIEEVLRKSNLSLARECEKLKSEKEELALKLLGPLMGETIDENTASARTPAKKRGGSRKPKRVSPKTK